MFSLDLIVDMDLVLDYLVQNRSVERNVPPDRPGLSPFPRPGQSQGKVGNSSILGAIRFRTLKRDEVRAGQTHSKQQGATEEWDDANCFPASFSWMRTRIHLGVNRLTYAWQLA